MATNRQYTTPLVLTGSVENGQVNRLDRIRFERSEEQDQSYDERWLQKLIQSHPDLLPIAEIEPAFRPIYPVCMELPTSRGYIDNFLITPNGNLVFVECKLWRNAEARREVVSQVLDYAESLTGWYYSDLEKAVQRGERVDGSRPEGSLYDCVTGDAELDEPEFIDAVSRNLRLGRGLFFIAGDGIREEAESLADHLQSHAGIHFALALMELALYRLPHTEGFLMQPRLIARTVNIERGIVRIDDERLSVAPGETKQNPATTSHRQTLSAEEFYEHMAKIDVALPDRLRAFLDRLEPLGITSEFRRTLILRWRAIDGTAFNLGYITTTGETWTEAVHMRAAELGILDLTTDYIVNLAAAIDGNAKQMPSNSDFRYVVIKDHVPLIEQLLSQEEKWISAIETFANKVNRRIDQTGN